MTTDPNQTAGTEADGNAVASGTTSDGNAGPTAEEVEQLRAENEQLRRVKDQALAEKSTLEAMKLRVAQLEQAGTPAPAGNDMMAIQASVMEDVVLARQGDTNAQLRVWMYQQQYQANQRAELAIAEVQKFKEMLSVPEADRGEVERIALEKGVTPSVAELILKGTRYDEASRKIQQKEQQIAAQRKPVGTAEASVTATQVAKDTMTSAEFNALYDRLEAGGDDKAAMELLRKKESGTLKIAR